MSARSIQITTWNVLHRIHAVNWNEKPRELFPDESIRISQISDRILLQLASISESVSPAAIAVCLQEVSGDQLASLRALQSASANANANTDRITIFNHAYPRVPKLRIDAPAELVDRTEHLVTVVLGTNARHAGSETFSRDPGKGYLAVDLGEGTTLINTHVTYGKRRDEQLAMLATTARAHTGTVIIVGDYNVEVDDVRSLFGDGFVVSDVSGQRHTRIATSEKQSRTIDHVVVLRGSIASANVLDAGGLSDHNPVVAIVKAGSSVPSSSDPV